MQLDSDSWVTAILFAHPDSLACFQACRDLFFWIALTRQEGMGCVSSKWLVLMPSRDPSVLPLHLSAVRPSMIISRPSAGLDLCMNSAEQEFHLLF